MPLSIAVIFRTMLAASRTRCSCPRRWRWPHLAVKCQCIFIVMYSFFSLPLFFFMFFHFSLFFYSILWWLKRIWNGEPTNYLTDPFDDVQWMEKQWKFKRIGCSCIMIYDDLLAWPTGKDHIDVPLNCTRRAVASFMPCQSRGMSEAFPSVRLTSDLIQSPFNEFLEVMNYSLT